MNYIFGFSFILVPVIVSLLVFVLRKQELNSIRTFSIDYLMQLNKYVESLGHDSNAHTYLTMNSNEMQNYLKKQGFMTVSLPFNRGTINHFAIIINGLSNIHDSFINESSNKTVYFFTLQSKMQLYERMVT